MILYIQETSNIFWMLDKVIQEELYNNCIMQCYPK